MRVPSLNQNDAIKIWDARNNELNFDYSKVVTDFIGSDDTDLSDFELSDLVEELASVKESYEGKDISRAVGGQIDRDVIKHVHSHLSLLATPYQLSQIGFWAWLSNLSYNGFFWQFLKWRFGGEKVINWGVTSQGRIIEVYFFRAWLRGHKMIEPTLPNPYKYAEKGGSEIWRSHLLRVEFGRDREFVKALLDTAYDDDNKTLVGANEMRKKLVPALRTWTSSASFSNLNYEECFELIQKLRHDEI